MNDQRLPEMPHPTLLLVRHAAVDDSDGVCYGASDWSANSAATDALANALAEQLPRDLCVLASPLQRCRQLAVALQARRPDLAFAVDPRLQEFNFGAWEGRRWADIDRHAFDRWFVYFWRRPPATGAETTAAFMNRVAAAWDACHARALDTLWITHAGVVRAAMLIARGARLPINASQWPRDGIRRGTIYAFGLDQPSRNGEAWC
jgi:alpha-ribazole phosphatase